MNKRSRLVGTIFILVFILMPVGLINALEHPPMPMDEDPPAVMVPYTSTQYRNTSINVTKALPDGGGSFPEPPAASLDKEVYIINGSNRTVTFRCGVGVTYRMIIIGFEEVADPVSGSKTVPLIGWIPISRISGWRLDFGDGTCKQGGVIYPSNYSFNGVIRKFSYPNAILDTKYFESIVRNIGARWPGVYDVFELLESNVPPAPLDRHLLYTFNVTHTYERDGVYVATLTVFDGYYRRVDSFSALVFANYKLPPSFFTPIGMEAWWRTAGDAHPDLSLRMSYDAPEDHEKLVEKVSEHWGGDVSGWYYSKSPLHVLGNWDARFYNGEPLYCVGETITINITNKVGNGFTLWLPYALEFINATPNPFNVPANSYAPINPFSMETNRFFSAKRWYKEGLPPSDAFDEAYYPFTSLLWYGTSSATVKCRVRLPPQFSRPEDPTFWRPSFLPANYSHYANPALTVVLSAAFSSPTGGGNINVKKSFSILPCIKWYKLTTVLGSGKGSVLPDPPGYNVIRYNPLTAENFSNHPLIGPISSEPILMVRMRRCLASAPCYLPAPYGWFLLDEVGDSITLRFPAWTFVDLSAEGRDGYAFDHWSGTINNHRKTTAILMDEDKTVTVWFKETSETEKTYRLRVLSSTPCGSGYYYIDPPGNYFNHSELDYPENTMVHIKALPERGYVFDYWSGDASGTDPDITIKMDSNKTIRANFKRDDSYTNTNNYPTIDFNADEYTDTLTVLHYSPDDLVWDKIVVFCYNDTDSTEIKRTGRISIGDVIDVGESGLTGHVTVYVLFQDDSSSGWSILLGVYNFYIPPLDSGNRYYTLTINVDPRESGEVIVSPLKDAYQEGDTVSIEARPKDGYKFDHWSGDISGTNPTIRVTMNSNKTLTAHFSRDTGDSLVSLNIVQPQRGILYIRGRAIHLSLIKRIIVIGALTVNVNASENIDRVTFYINGEPVYTDTDRPFECRIDKRCFGRRSIEVSGYDTETGREVSQSIDVFMINIRGKG